jgi:hypothetical protein
MIYSPGPERCGGTYGFGRVVLVVDLSPDSSPQPDTLLVAVLVVDTDWVRPFG